MGIAHIFIYSVSMLCSSSESNESFGHFLLDKADLVSDDLQGVPSTFYELAKPDIWREKKPIVWMLDEVQIIYDVPYATKFWEHLKRIKQAGYGTDHNLKVCSQPKTYLPHTITHTLMSGRHRSRCHPRHIRWRSPRNPDSLRPGPGRLANLL